MQTTNFQGQINDLRVEKQRVETELQRVIENISTYSRIKDSDNIYKYAFELSFNAISSVATRILMEEARKAIEKVPEFNDARWFEGLYVAIGKKETITIQHIRGTKIKVVIDLDRTAGPIEEYAESVIQARIALKMGIKPNPKASLMWREKIYKPGRMGGKVKRRVYNRSTKKYKKVDYTWFYKPLYWKTIEARKSFWTSPAPWWRLLDHGTSLRLGSDRADVDGVAYPKHAGTHFVRNSVKIIETLFSENIQIYLAKAKRSLAAKIGSANRKRKNLEILIKEVSSTIIELEKKSSIALQRYSRARELISQKLGENIDRTDPNKLERLLQSLTYNNRYEVGGSVRLGGGIRTRVISILNQINAEFGTLD